MLLLCKDTVHVHRSTTPLSETVLSSNYNNMDATCTRAQVHLVSLASLIRSGVGNMSYVRDYLLLFTVDCVLLYCTLHVYYCTALCMCVTALSTACLLLYTVYYCTACTLLVCYTGLCITVLCYCTMHFSYIFIIPSLFSL